MSEKRIFQAAVILSVGLHLTMLLGAAVYRMPGAQSLMEETRKMFDVKKVDVVLPEVTRQQTVKGYVEKLKFSQPKLSAEERLKAGIKEINAPKIRSESESPDILEKSSEVLQAPSPIKQQFDIKKREINPDTQVELDIFKAFELDVRGSDVQFELPDDYSETMFGFTPSFMSSDASAAAFGTMAGEAGRIGQAGVAQGDLNDEMQLRMQTYRNPKDGQGYFRLSISPGQGASGLPVLPKEIVFLVDASLSIKEKRIQKFIRGIKHSVRSLNPEDKFNIYTFKDSITQLFPYSVDAQEDNVNRAVRFVTRLEPSEQTDIYEAFLESIQDEASMNPSYIVFLSDGKPTQGLTSSAKLIGRISKINKRKRPIFAFSAGDDVNRYLLDFLSYANRGWSEYASTNHEIEIRLPELYEKIKNPLLSNVTYQLAGIDSEEVYPKYIPDFFLNTEFVVYGKLDDAENYSLRITGQSIDGEREFYFSKSINEAQAGDKSIMMYWVFNKYYHLISRITLEGKSPEVMAELKELSRKYGLKAPYKF